MLGEFLRDATVLVPVFFLLEFGLKGQLTFPFVIGILSFSLLLLILGIIREKLIERPDIW